MNNKISKPSFSVLKVGISTLIWLGALPAANAQTTTPTAPATATQSPYETCKSENPNADHQAVKSCVKTARKAAFQACNANLNPPITKGTKPAFAQRQALAQCMVGKGFISHRHHRHMASQNG